jgi:hypothetical protein
VIVVNFDNVMYVYISTAENGVTLHFIDGSDMSFFGVDAERVKTILRRKINNDFKWEKVSYGREE